MFEKFDIDLAKANLVQIEDSVVIMSQGEPTRGIKGKFAEVARLFHEFNNAKVKDYDVSVQKDTYPSNSYSLNLMRGANKGNEPDTLGFYKILDDGELHWIN